MFLLLPIRLFVKIEGEYYMKNNLLIKKVRKLLVLEITIFVLILIFGYRIYVFVSSDRAAVLDGQPFGISQIPAKVGGDMVLDPNTNIRASHGSGITQNKDSYRAESFRSFKYSALSEQFLEVSGSCKDDYYAILIFRKNDDFIKSAGSAKYNRASSCPASGKFIEKIDLKSINLTEGLYYFFVADQGASGSWYNPR